MMFCKSLLTAFATVVIVSFITSPAQAADVRYTFWLGDPVHDSWIPVIDEGTVSLGGPASTALSREVAGGALGAYANDSGRVRAFVKLGGVNPAEGTTKLVWRKTFRKRAEDNVAQFTINRSHLELVVSDPNYDCCPSASLSMQVNLYDPQRSQIETIYNDFSGIVVKEIEKKYEQFSHYALIDRPGTQYNIIDLASERTKVFGSTVWDLSDAGAPGAAPVISSSFRSGEFLARGDGRYQMEVYHGEIRLDAIEVGELYTIEYNMNVSAEYDGGEFYAEAFLGDPLDVDSGFSFTTTSDPVDDQPHATMCDVQSNASRFRYDAANTTVTDTYTGLMWQRCPLGYSVNINGTPNTLHDDTCSLTGAAGVNWQTALQLSASNSLAGHADWHLPNTKELDSIVELGCHLPTIDAAPFPGTPAEFFWTSTPGLTGDVARAIDFGMGISSPKIKTSTAHVRPVRTDDQPTLAPLPAVQLGKAVASESDANIVFPIALDRAPLANVTFDYATRNHTAVSGVDYVTTSGTITIPAGSRHAEISVPILNDTLAEGYESFYLRLSNVSAAAWLSISENLGQINDDEPLVSIAATSAPERGSAAAPLPFTVTLSSPAAANVSINYTSANGTAIAGSDYTAAAGTLLIPAGSTSGTISIDVLADTLTESEENLSVTLTGVSTNARLSPSQSRALGFIIDDDTLTLRALNDTGVVQCSDTSSAPKLCTQTPAFPGQDAQFGRDATNNDQTDGVAGFSFTKLTASGAPLANQAAGYSGTPWDCVRDEVTGLTWEVKTDNGGLRDKDWTYSWFNSLGSNDGNGAGKPNGGVCVDGTQCDTEKYVTAVNASGMCGHSDWRMPTREELQSILDIGDRTSPHYDSGYFPNAPTALLSFAHWTSTPDASSAIVAWAVLNLQGRSGTYEKERAFPVRLVRAGN